MVMRTNGTFSFKPKTETAVKDPATGWNTYSGNASGWVEGCECQISRSIPARQITGVDGVIQSYTYDVFIPKYFVDAEKLKTGTEIMLTGEDGNISYFTVSGVDSYNRKYIELWG